MNFNEFEDFLININQNKKYVGIFSYNDIDMFDNSKYSFYFNSNKSIFYIKVPEETFILNLNKSFNFYIQDNTIKVSSESFSVFIPLENIKIESFPLVNFFLKIINHNLIKYSFNNESNFKL